MMRPPLMSTLTWRYPCQSQDEAVQAVCGGLSGKRQTLFGRPGVSIWLACIATTHDQDRRGGEEEMKGEELVLFQDFWLTPSRKVGASAVARKSQSSTSPLHHNLLQPQRPHSSPTEATQPAGKAKCCSESRDATRTHQRHAIHFAHA